MALLLDVILGLFIVVALRFGPKDANGNRPLLSAYNLVLVLCTFYGTLSAAIAVANGSYFVWAPSFSGDANLSEAVAAAIAGTVMFVAAYGISARRQPATAGSRPPNEPAPDRTPAGPTERLALWGLVLLGWAMKLYVISASGGLHAATLRLSVGVSASSHLAALPGHVVLIRYLSSVADGAAAWLLVEAIRTDRRRTTAVVLFALTVGFTYVIGGKRLLLVWPLIAVAMAWHVYRRPLRARLLPLLGVGALVLGFVTLAVRIFLPASIAGTPVQVDQVPYAHGSVTGFYLNSQEFSAIQMLAVTQHDASGVNALFGGRWQAFLQTDLEPTLYAVPRLVWRSKPQHFEDVGYGLESQLTGTPLSGVPSGLISTIFGVNYTYGGYVALLLATGLLGFIAARIDRGLGRLRWRPHNVLVYAFLLNLTFQAFRQGTLGWTVINGVIDQLGFVAAVAIVYLCRSRSEQATSGETTTTPPGRLPPATHTLGLPRRPSHRGVAWSSRTT